MLETLLWDVQRQFLTCFLCHHCVLDVQGLSMQDLLQSEGLHLVINSGFLGCLNQRSIEILKQLHREGQWEHHQVQVGLSSFALRIPQVQPPGALLGEFVVAEVEHFDLVGLLEQHPRFDDDDGGIL